MQLVAEIRVTVKLGDMSVRVRQADRRVGHDLVEIAHQIVLAHHRQARQDILIQRRQINVAEPTAVPGRALERQPHELAQARCALGAQPLRRPRHTLEMLSDLGQQVFNMALAPSLMGLHSIAPYRGTYGASRNGG